MFGNHCTELSRILFNYLSLVELGKTRGLFIQAAIRVAKESVAVKSAQTVAKGPNTTEK
jgi:hypothetical protein